MKGTRVRQLRTMITELDKRDLASLLSTFKCYRSKDSERFLKEIAVIHEKRGISRTYLIMDFDDKRILGYYTLAIKCLSADSSEIDPEIVRTMNIKDGIAQAYLIGQLARADDTVPGLGRMMISDALDRFSVANGMLGCRTVRLDCRDELIDYYTLYGFRHIRKNFDNDLNQMAVFI